EHCLLPFFLPYCIKDNRCRIRKTLQRGCSRCLCRDVTRARELDLLPALSELISNAPADNRQEPPLKCAHIGIVPETLNLITDSKDGFLPPVLRLRVANPSAERRGKDQAPVRVEKFPPALLGIRLLEATKEAAPCRQR